MSEDLNLSDERYLAALKRIRALIANGINLVAEDSDVMGDKFTHCTWGLCSDRKSHWPDPEDHLWPDQFVEHGRVAPKYRDTDKQECPLCVPHEGSGFKGCFYRCRVFQRKMKTPTREQALRLYDEAIARVEARV